jgi:tRNA (guanine37-N1)-methyltransferase
VDLELSIGDFVVSGGEIPALLVIDAVLRLLPGAIDAQSTVEESFSHGLLEYPQYTRPPVFRDMAVPDVLTSGHHGAVASWRHEKAVARTRRQRPDLLGGAGPSGAPPPADLTTEAGLPGDRQGGDVRANGRSGSSDV